MLRTLRLLLVPLAFAQADVLVRGFETGVDVASAEGVFHNDSSKVVATYDSVTSPTGSTSSRIDYVLDPQTTEWPWAGVAIPLGKVLDLRGATGIHVKLHSDQPDRAVDVVLGSEWYPSPHNARGVQYQWTFQLPLGDLDTVLPLASATLPDWAATSEPYLTATASSLTTALQGVSWVSFSVRPGTMPTASMHSGSLWIDDIAITGVASLTLGSIPKKLPLRDNFETAVVGYPDSIASSWLWSNPASTMSIKRNPVTPSWGTADLRCDYQFSNEPGKGWSVFAGFGLGLRGDSAWDLRGTYRWEFSENTGDPKRPVWIHLASNRYPKELIDSGIVYGWYENFQASIRSVEGHVMYTDSLKPPTWAASHTRLLAMLPPIDSILKGVTGIEFSPEVEFTTTGAVTAASASGFIQVNHILAFGVDEWLPSPPKWVAPPLPQVMLQNFEAGVDSNSVKSVWSNDSSKISLVDDSVAPLAGKHSAKVNYVLDPRTTPYPYVGAFTWLGQTHDMRHAKGIRIKLESSVAGRQISIVPASNWYPIGNSNLAVMWRWDLVLPQGTIDTVLLFADAALPAWAKQSQPDMVAATPSRSEILQGVTGLLFNITTVASPTVAAAAGSLRWDEIALVGTDHVVAGTEPKKLIWYSEDRPVVAGHPDSAASTYYWSNRRTKVAVTRNTVLPTWGFSDLRFDFDFANDSAKTFAAYAGFGLGMPGDSAWDLRGMTRLEYAQNTPDSLRRVWVHLASNRYPQELVDSGVTYGWNDEFRASEQPWVGQALSISDLVPPSWITSERLLAMLPPVDSVLKGVTGIEFSPQADFLGNGAVKAASAKSFLQVDAFHLIGIDHWVAAPALPVQPPKPADSASVLVRTFEPGIDSSLASSATWANDSSSFKLTLDSLKPISGKASARLDYILDPRTTQYPWAGAFTWFKGLYDLRTTKGLRIKLRSEQNDRVIEIRLSSNWYPLPHNSRGVHWRWIFPLHQGLLDTTLEIAKAELPDWAPTNEPYLTRTVPRLAEILQGSLGFAIDIRPGTMPTTAVHAGTVTWDDVSLVGSDTLTPGADPKILVLRDVEYDTVVASHPLTVPHSWQWASANSNVTIKRNTVLPTWGNADLRCDFKMVNDSGKPYSAYGGFGLGLRADSAWDLRGTKRWEFEENTPDVSRNVWIDLASNRYPKELVDSGIVYGWNEEFVSSERNGEGRVLYTDSLKPPAWAKAHTRLLKLLPPLDSVLAGVTGFEFSPQPVWDSAGRVVTATASSFLQVNHLLAVGVDTWIPASKPGIPTAVKSHLASRPWSLAGQILQNAGEQPLEVLNLKGQVVVRLLPAHRVRLGSGFHLVRMGASAQILAVP